MTAGIPSASRRKNKVFSLCSNLCTTRLKHLKSSNKPRIFTSYHFSATSKFKSLLRFLIRTSHKFFEILCSRTNKPHHHSIWRPSKPLWPPHINKFKQLIKSGKQCASHSWRISSLWKQRSATMCSSRTWTLQITWSLQALPISFTRSTSHKRFRRRASHCSLLFNNNSWRYLKLVFSRLLSFKVVFKTTLKTLSKVVLKALLLL